VNGPPFERGHANHKGPKPLGRYRSAADGIHTPHVIAHPSILPVRAGQTGVPIRRQGTTRTSR